MSQTTVSGKGHPDLAPAPIRAEQAVGSRSALAVFAASLAVAMLLAAGLRLYQLPRASFWADELYSVESIVYQREHPLELWRFASHLPVRLGLWASGAEIDRARIDRPEDWRSLGIHETSTRIGPAIVGILTVPLLGLASLRLLGPRGASVLMILLAVSPWHLYWSQNARFYILLFLFYNLALILYYLGSRHQSRPHLVAGMVFAVVAYLIHPPAIFLFAILAADWLVAHLRGRPVPLGQAGRLAVTLALGACLALLAWEMHQRAASWGRVESQPRSHDAATLVLGTVYMVQPVIVALAALAGWHLLARGRRLGWYLLLAAAVPLVILVVLSYQSFVHVRYNFFAFYAWLALAAVGIDRLYLAARPHVGRVLAAAPLIIAAVAVLQVSYYYHRGAAGFRSRWDEAFAYVARHAQPGDQIATNFTLAGRYYLERPDVDSMPDTPAGLRARQGRLWIVTATESAQGHDGNGWVGGVARLEATFDTRIEQPFSSVRVYLRDATPAETNRTSPR